MYNQIPSSFPCFCIKYGKLLFIIETECASAPAPRANTTCRKIGAIKDKEYSVMKRKFRLSTALDIDDVLMECTAYAVKLANEKY